MHGQSLVERSQSLRIEASAHSATLAVTLFGLLDARAATASTLCEIRHRRMAGEEEVGDAGLLPAISSSSCPDAR
jgi:hypothetical protein